MYVGWDVNMLRAIKHSCLLDTVKAVTTRILVCFELLVMFVLNMSQLAQLFPCKLFIVMLCDIIVYEKLL